MHATSGAASAFSGVPGSSEQSVARFRLGRETAVARRTRAVSDDSAGPVEESLAVEKLVPWQRAVDAQLADRSEVRPVLLRRWSVPPAFPMMRTAFVVTGRKDSRYSTKCGLLKASGPGGSGGLINKPSTAFQVPSPARYSTSRDVNQPPFSSTAPVWQASKPMHCGWLHSKPKKSCFGFPWP